MYAHSYTRYFACLASNHILVTVILFLANTTAYAARMHEENQVMVFTSHDRDDTPPQARPWYEGDLFRPSKVSAISLFDVWVRALSQGAPSFQPSYTRPGTSSVLLADAKKMRDAVDESQAEGLPIDWDELSQRIGFEVPLSDGQYLDWATAKVGAVGSPQKLKLISRGERSVGFAEPRESFVLLGEDLIDDGGCLFDEKLLRQDLPPYVTIAHGTSQQLVRWVKQTYAVLSRHQATAWYFGNNHDREHVFENPYVTPYSKHERRIKEHLQGHPERKGALLHHKAVLNVPHRATFFRCFGYVRAVTVALVANGSEETQVALERSSSEELRGWGARVRYEVKGSGVPSLLINLAGPRLETAAQRWSRAHHNDGLLNLREARFEHLISKAIAALARTTEFKGFLRERCQHWWAVASVKTHMRAVPDGFEDHAAFGAFRRESWRLATVLWGTKKRPVPCTRVATAETAAVIALKLRDMWGNQLALLLRRSNTREYAQREVRSVFRMKQVDKISGHFGLALSETLAAFGFTTYSPLKSKSTGIYHIGPNVQGNRLRDELLDFGHFDFLEDPLGSIGEPHRWYSDQSGERRHWGGDGDPFSDQFSASLLEPRLSLRRPDLVAMLRTWHKALQPDFQQGRKAAFVNGVTFWSDGEGGPCSRPPRSLGGSAVQWASISLHGLGLSDEAAKADES